MINTKNLIIDVDNSKALSNVGSSIETQLTNLFRGTEYLVKCSLVNVYSNVASFALSDDDQYYVVISNSYGETATPVIEVSNSASFNSTSDWSNVSPSTGTMCFRLPTTSSELAVSLGNSSSKNYTMEIWAFNTDNEGVLLCDTTAVISNIISEP